MKDQPKPEESGATVRVRYECKKCGWGRWHKLKIREREPAETLESWQRDVALVVGTHHRMVSPRCRSVHVDIKVEVSKAAGCRVGAAPPVRQ